MTLVERVAADLYRVRRTLLTMPYLADAMQFVASIVTAVALLAVLGSIVPTLGYPAWVAGGLTALAWAVNNLRLSWRRRNGDTLEVVAAPSLEGLDLRDRELASIRLYDRDLTGALLGGADLTHATLTGATLDRTSLPGANLSYASLNVSHCVDATFVRARLFGARLDKAWAKGARFDDADLRHASFIEADLRGATFAGADVRGADFRSARLDPTALAAAITSSATVLPDGDPAVELARPIAVRWRAGMERTAWLGSLRSLLQVVLGAVMVLTVAGVTIATQILTEDRSSAAARGTATPVSSADEPGDAFGEDSMARRRAAPSDVDPGALRGRGVDSESDPDFDSDSNPNFDSDRAENGSGSAADVAPESSDEPSTAPDEASGQAARSSETADPGELDELSPVEADRGQPPQAGNDPAPVALVESEPSVDGAAALAEGQGPAEADADPDVDLESPDLGGGAASIGDGTVVRLIVTSTGGASTVSLRSVLGEGAFAVTADRPLSLKVPPTGVLRVAVDPNAATTTGSCSVLVDGVEALGRLGSPGEPLTCELDLDRRGG